MLNLQTEGQVQPANMLNLNTHRQWQVEREEQQKEDAERISGDT